MRAAFRCVRAVFLFLGLLALLVLPGVAFALTAFIYAGCGGGCGWDDGDDGDGDRNSGGAPAPRRRGGDGSA